MITTITVGILLVAWLWLFFLLYIGAMGVIRAHKAKKLNNYLYTLCSPFLLIAWLYDVASNLTIVSVIFMELPRRPTVTDRLKRHIKNKGYRGALARFMCQKILSPFDPSGDHCD
tara:strand:- start:292 stop:636 length:345 start_codon:yes stop_codon:yes gene_type:complete